MSKAIRASALVLLLACAAYAGDIQNGSPTPPPQASTVQDPTVGGVTQDDTPSSLPGLALDLLAVLPSLL